MLRVFEVSWWRCIDYCIARHERRPFTDRKSGELQTPHGKTAAHYHLRVACIKAAEESFVPMSLRRPPTNPYSRGISEGGVWFGGVTKFTQANLHVVVSIVKTLCFLLRGCF